MVPFLSRIYLLYRVGVVRNHSQILCLSFKTSKLAINLGFHLRLGEVIAVETAPSVPLNPEHCPSTAVWVRLRAHYGLLQDRSFLPILFNVIVKRSDIYICFFLSFKLSYLNLSNLNKFFFIFLLHFSQQKKMLSSGSSENFDIMFDIFVVAAKLAEQTYEAACSSAAGSAERRTRIYVYRNHEIAHQRLM